MHIPFLYDYHFKVRARVRVRVWVRARVRMRRIGKSRVIDTVGSGFTGLEREGKTTEKGHIWEWLFT